MEIVEYESKPDKPRKGKHANFWRACGFLGPYRRLVIISVLCALLNGLVFTTGLGAMLPIFRVLIEGDTIGGWVDRKIMEHRLGVKLSDDPRPQIVKIKLGGVVFQSGLLAGSALFVDSHAGDSVTIDAAGNPLVLSGLPPAPWYLGLADSVSDRMPSHPVKAIGVVFGLIALLAIVGSVIRFFQEHLSDRAAIYAVNDIRRRLYDHVLHIPMGFFGLKGTSDVTSRLVQDSQGLQEGFKTVLGQSIQEPIKAGMALGLAMFISWKLTLFIVLFTPLMMLLIRKFGKKMRRASRKALQTSAGMLGQIEGTLIGIRVVKSAGAERFERRRYRGIMQNLIREQIRMSRIDTLSAPTIETLSLLVIGGVVMYAAYLVLIAKSLEPSSFFLVMACLFGIGESLRKISKVNNHLQKANAAAGRIFETLDVPVERPRTALAAKDRPKDKLPPIQREVRFENVSFTYAGGTSPAVSEVSLTVPKGKSIAIVGRNGSGKTTLLALLPRFYDPDRGRVSIDGIDLRNVTLRSLRQQISIVTQDSVIFPGTIAENIAYGHPLAGRLADLTASSRALREQIEHAAKRAFAHEFIMEKSAGYDALLDGLGGQLSGGQKQRINIARAILRQSPILILDEATSQVDAESEHLIQQAIESLMHERTTFVIAHRFSTILSADEIVVMDRGKIVGQGQHDELLRTCETYQQLYERQLVGQRT